MKLIKTVCAEAKEAIVPIIFLFVMFHLIALSNSLLLESYRITPASSMFATVGALIGGKAILVANKLPFTHFFQSRPLILSVVWRSIVYAAFCAAFLVLERLISGALHGPGLEESHHASLAHACANALWLALSLLLYNSYVELDRVLGKGTLRRAFLSSPGAAGSPAGGGTGASSCCSPAAAQRANGGLL